MSIDRSANPTLKDFKMITRKKNWIDFVPKTDTDIMKSDEELLETLEELKEEYYKENKAEK